MVTYVLLYFVFSLVYILDQEKLILLYLVASFLPSPEWKQI